MRLLFVKDHLAWPRSSGHDVHTAAMMRAVRGLGHETALLTAGPPPAGSLDGLGVSHAALFGEALADADRDRPLPLTGMQERFRRYWGVGEDRVRAVASFAERWRADAVVAVGLGVLPYLAGVRGAVRVWYAADDWVWHHLSLVRRPDAEAAGHVKQAVVKGLYQRAYAPAVDRAWAVSDTDALFLRRLAGFRRVDVVPNGVDADHYAPASADEVPDSCVFWGRLDFEPNQQALEWFVTRAWPGVRARVPGARFTVYGFQPTPAVERLMSGPGLELVPDRPDIRADVCKHAVVVLPFVSGGGIKNKLLEAAAMARPVAASPRALNGVRQAPFAVCRTPAEWAGTLAGLWADAGRRREQGDKARAWVTERHDWAAAAKVAVAGLAESARA